MNQNVTIDAASLRPHLRRWFAVESDRAAEATSARRDADGQAEEHHLRAAAIAALLAHIGWSYNATTNVTIDALQHGWAAREALRTLILAEERVIDRESAAGEYEAAGDAMGRRHDAAVAIAEIEEAVARAGASIESPALPPADDGVDVQQTPSC